MARPRDILLRLTGDSTAAQKSITDLTSDLKDLDAIHAEAVAEVRTLGDAALADLRGDVEKFDGLTAEARAEIKTAGAEAKLEQLKTRLERLSQQEATPQVRIAQAQVVNQIERIESRLRAIPDQDVNVRVRRTGDDPEPAKDEGGGGIVGVLGKGKGGAVAGGAALAAAAVSGFSDALDRGELVAALRAQLRLSERESEKAGKIAGDVFRDNYGESIADVGEAIRALVANAGVSIDGGNIDEFAKKILNLKDQFGAEANDVSTVLNTLVKKGLVGSIDEGLDIITDGFNRGANRTGDYLETFQEYAPKLKELGISAQDFSRIAATGLDAGAQNADKLADALKEAQIRSVDGNKATKQAFESIGLDGDKTAARIAEGGSTAKKAFQEVVTGLLAVKDPQKQLQTGFAIFGTQLEDLGVGAIPAFKPLTDGANEAKGATDDLDNAIGSSLAARIEGFKRQATGAFADASGAALNFGEDAVPKIGDAFNAVKEAVKEAFEFIKRKLREARQAFRDFRNKIGDYAQDAKEAYGRFLDSLATAAGRAVRSAVKVLKGAGGKFAEAGLAVGGAFVAAFTAAFSGIKSIAATAINAAISVVNLGIRTLNKVLGPRDLKLLGKSPDLRIGEIDPVKFASGGLVPGQGAGDRVAAMLTPGEFVLRKSAVQALGGGNLAQLNAGRLPAGRGPIHNHISVPGGGPPDPKVLAVVLSRELGRRP